MISKNKEKKSLHQLWVSSDPPGYATGCSREHKARGQGHKKILGQGQPFRGQTHSRPRTGMLEAKVKNQGHKRKCSPKKKSTSLRKFFRRFPKKKRYRKKIFQPIYKILTIQKIVLSSRRRQSNFRGLGASRSRPRTSKCVLKDIHEAKDVLEDSTSTFYF